VRLAPKLCQAPWQACYEWPSYG
jgi:hypothetical protein